MAPDDIVERAALAQRKADGPVPALRTGARGDEVTNAGQAAEGEDLAAERHAQAAELGQATRDRARPACCRPGQPVGDAGRDGHDVLRGSGDLTPDDVGPHVGPKRPCVHQRLHTLGHLLVGQCDHAPRRVALRDFRRQVGPGQHAGRDAGEDLGDDLGHAQHGAGFESLGQADDRLDSAGEGRQVLQHGTKAMGGHGHEHDPGARQCLVEGGR